MLFNKWLGIATLKADNTSYRSTERQSDSYYTYLELCLHGYNIFVVNGLNKHNNNTIQAKSTLIMFIQVYNFIYYSII